MEQNKKTKFFELIQNNSGGYFVTDDKNGICEIVIIEAYNISEAWEKLCAIGEQVDGFWDFCNCCGERWYKPFDGGQVEPTFFGTPLSKIKKDFFRKRAYVHYYNNVFKEHTFK